MIAHVSRASIRHCSEINVMSANQSNCDLGLRGRSGLLHPRDQLGRSSVAWLLRGYFILVYAPVSPALLQHPRRSSQ